MSTAELKTDSPLELRIVFDASAIYTASAGNLLRDEISSLILNSAGDDHLRIAWYIPDIVVSERRRHITTGAFSELSHVTKFERTIRQKFNITEDTINARVDESIKAQIAEHRLNVCRCDPAQVNWNALIENAVNRNPPFEPENEKGFRDALILESFCQLVATSPPESQCRIFLVTGDNLLAKAAESATEALPNVRVLRTFDEVKGMINTLVSTLTEDEVQKLREIAKRFFFDENSQSGFIKAHQVGAQIQETCRAHLAALPPGAIRRQNERKWLVASGPSFVKKVHDRVHWASRVKVRALAFQSLSDAYSRRSVFDADIPQGQGSPFTWVASGEDPTAAPAGYLVASGSTQLPPGSSSMALPPGTTITIGTSSQPVETLVARGVTTVIVNWSASVDAKNRFHDPKVEGIEFVATEWDHT